MSTGRAALGRRLLLATLAPLVAFGLLESALRLAGYGFEPRLLLKDRRTGFLVTNPDFGRLFFPRALARRPVQQWIQDPKPAGEFRAFVIGESAALGIPDPAYGFSRQLEVLMNGPGGGAFTAPNLAMTAINSHAFPRIAREALDHGADALIVLAGNNEFVGPFGAGTVFDHGPAPRAAIRLTLWLRGTRTGQLVAALREAAGGGSIDTWRGLEMFADRRVAAADPRLARTRAAFRDNLAEVLEAAHRRGVPVLLCTVPVNLRDCAPFASGAEPSARSAFQAGRAALAAGDGAGAAAALQRACDLDELRLRADSANNAIVRALAARSPGVRLVDAAAAFAADGPPGAERFHEHVHLTFAGNYELARLVAAPLAGVASSAPPLAPREAVAAALAYTAHDAARLEGEMLEMVRRPPFTAQDDHAEDLAARRARVQSLRLAAGRERDADAARYAAAVAARPGDFLLRLNHATFLDASAADPAAAAAAWRWISARLPEDSDGAVRAALASGRAGRSAEARRELEALIAARPRDMRPREGLAELLFTCGPLDEAGRAFEDVLARAPGYGAALGNLALVRQRQGRLPEAERLFRQALEQRRDPGMLLNLANLLAKSRRYAEALPLFEEADVRDDPAFLNNLGLTQMALGNFAGAAESLAAALSLNPRHPTAEASLGQALVHAGRTAEALPHLRAMLARGFHPGAAAALALALAASADAAQRQPGEALELMREVERRVREPFAEQQESLAAAEAAAGRCADAAQHADEAARLYDEGGRPASAALLRDRAARYRAGLPAWLPAPPGG